MWVFEILTTPRYRRSPWNPSLPEVHWAFDPQAAFPASCSWNCSGLQVGSSLPIFCHRCSSRVRRSLSRVTLRGHQSLCYPCQACYHPVQGHPARSSSPWWTLVNFSWVTETLTGLMGWRLWDMWFFFIMTTGEKWRVFVYYRSSHGFHTGLSKFFFF